MLNIANEFVKNICVTTIFGAPRRIRTLSLLIRSQMLYPVKLWALARGHFISFPTKIKGFFGNYTDSYANI